MILKHGNSQVDVTFLINFQKTDLHFCQNDFDKFAPTLALGRFQATLTKSRENAAIAMSFQS
jgi:hypothetical protein